MTNSTKRGQPQQELPSIAKYDKAVKTLLLRQRAVSLTVSQSMEHDVVGS
jgi:hypothetical protein